MFALGNCSQLIAEPIQQLTKLGERAARGGIGNCLLESGKSKRDPDEILPGMIMQVARDPLAFLPHGILNRVELRSGQTIPGCA